MSRSVSRRGRMRSEDQLRMQINAQFIDYEVDGKDLVTSLYSYQTIDIEDKEEIMSKPTQVERIRKLSDILLFRGPNAFDDFLRCLDTNGYEHVAYRLRNTLPEESRYYDNNNNNNSNNNNNNTESATSGKPPGISRQATVLSNVSGQASTTGKKRNSCVKIAEDNLDDNVFLTSSSNDATDMGKPLVVALANSGGSLDFKPGDLVCCCSDTEDSDSDDPDSKPISERVKSIEDSIYILSRRVTRAENRAQASAKLPEEELHILKVELTLLKTDTMQQISDLTKENELKDAIIRNLSRDVDEKKTKLERAQSKIDLLERRISTLETEKKRAEADLRLVKQRLEDNEKQLEEQHSYFNAEGLRMRNQMLCQQKKAKDQETALVELQKKDMENSQRFQHQQEQIMAAQDELREQQLNMAEQHQRINDLANVIRGIAQSGVSGPSGGANPLMCISGNSVSSSNEKGPGLRNAGKRWTNTAHHKCTSKRK